MYKRQATTGCPALTKLFTALKEIREGLGLAPRTSVFFNSAMYFDFVGLKCFSRTNYCFLKKFFILKQSKQNDKIVDIRSVYCIILPKSH